MIKKEKETIIKTYFSDLSYRFDKMKRLFEYLQRDFYTTPNEPIEVRVDKNKLEMLETDSKKFFNTVSRFLVERKLIWDEELKHKAIIKDIMKKKIMTETENKKWRVLRDLEILVDQLVDKYAQIVKAQEELNFAIDEVKEIVEDIEEIYEDLEETLYDDAKKDKS